MLPSEQPPPPASSRQRRTTRGERRGRSRSVNDHQRGGDDTTPVGKSKRHRSTGGIRKNHRSSMRIKSQYESLKRRGLVRFNHGSAGKVEFAYLEVREYPMVLGDNPSVVDGPPVQLDWAHDPQTMFVLDVNTFERMRGTRRPSSQMVLSRSLRERSLLRIGFSKKDMVAAVRQVRKDKHSRVVSSQQVGMDNVHESVEKLGAGLKKMFVFKKSQYEKTLEASCNA